jgi:hypothetical protein
MSFHNDKSDELRLTETLKQCGVKRFSRQGVLLRIEHSLEKNGKVDWTVILFKVKPEGFYATLQDFEDNCYRSKVTRQITQQIMAALSLDDDYYQNALKYYDGENNQGILGTAIKIGDFFEDGNGSQQQQQQETSPITSDNSADKIHIV